ncbi:MAG TPA: F0F1 ATP synthase subunit delta [Thermomicrobiales bacterium]|nr:F0F1 ATP synthase subunit delta [Thermomicrobiales bacterium]
MASGSARRYAQALTELARESGSFDAWQRDLDVLNALVRDEQVRFYLTDPGVQNEQKFTAVDAVLDGVEPEARNLLHILIARRKVDILPDVARHFAAAAMAERGIVVADVTTADALDDAGKELVREQLKRIVGKDVELRLHEDARIIGGIVARIGDQVIDGSVVNQLRRLRARLNVA